jgi:NAD(P)-dependent dehydrogenase (short-subunit alcohol dehydrogenase family)
MQLNSSIAAVVTGGASGLGRATAELLAGKGVKVALFDMNAEQGTAVAAQIGGVFCRVDVTSDADVDAGLTKARCRTENRRARCSTPSLAEHGAAATCTSPRPPRSTQKPISLTHPEFEVLKRVLLCRGCPWLSLEVTGRPKEREPLRINDLLTSMAFPGTQ